MKLIVDSRKLPVGWIQTTLGNVCVKVEYGLSAKSKTEGEIPVLRMGNIQNGIIDWGNLAYTTDQEEINKYLLQHNDILFDRTNSAEHVGKSAIYKSERPAVFAGYLIRLHRKEDLIDADFLNYYLNSHPARDYGKSVMSRSVNQANINGTKLKEYPISLPPLSEQKRIVAIVDQAFEAIDVAIENTKQNLVNARELFDSYLQNLNAEKELLGNLVDIRTGKLDANAATEDGQYPFFTCSRDIYKIDNFAFDCEAILLAGNNAVGDFNVKHYKGKFNAYQRTYVITINGRNKILYRYLYFQMLKSLKEFKLQSVGSGTKFLKLGMIQGLRMALPSIEKQQEILSTLDKLEAKTQRLEAIYRQKLAALTELKQSILQKAFTGELTAKKETTP
jgi:type I restriction enzyme, S subunit